MVCRRTGMKDKCSEEQVSAICQRLYSRGDEYHDGWPSVGVSGSFEARS